MSFSGLAFGEERGKITHHEVGAIWALAKCKALGFTEEEGQKVSWLVKNHLRLSNMAASMNYQERATVDRVCEFIPSINHLNMLAILTTADIMGIGAGKWTSIKNIQLKHLHENTAGVIEKHEIVAREHMNLPEGYQPGETRIELRSAFNGSATELVFITPDHNFLFENVIGALTAANNNIIDGSAATHLLPDGSNVIIDSLVFQDSAGNPCPPEREAYIKKCVADAIKISGRGEYQGKIGKHITVAKTFPVTPLVEIANDVSADDTFVKVTGRDKPGLLYTLARKFNDLGLGVYYLQLSADGHQVRNSFYVRTRDGGKLPEHRFGEAQAAIYACVAE